jgi:hypothetical protein
LELDALGASLRVRSVARAPGYSRSYGRRPASRWTGRLDLETSYV